MKKIILKSILVLSVLSTTYSCREDVLDSYIPGSLTEEQALTSVNDLGVLMNSVYNNINSRSESVEVSILTDEVGIGFTNGGQGLNGLYDFNLRPTSLLPRAMWDTPYITLSKINRFFKYTDIVPAETDEDKDKLKMLKFQAHTLRAYLHLRILAYFSTDIKDDNALAGILSDKFFTLEEALVNKRSTNAKFYNFIHQDLDAAIALYPTIVDKTEIETATKIKASLPFVFGLKARTYSYQEDYTNAEQYADALIGQIPLSTRNNYANVFHKDESVAGVIFKLKRQKRQNSQGYNLHNGWCFKAPNVGGTPFYEVSRSLFNKLDDNDIRKQVIVAPSSVIDANYQNSPDYRETDKLIIQKHGGSLTGTPAATASRNGFHNDIKVMRVAEMYFIKAEARANASDYAGVKQVLNTLRSQRYSVMPALPSVTSDEDAWKFILDEKRIEFAYEGYRYIDLKRMAQKANTGIDRDPADYALYPNANPSNMEMTSHKWALPISQSEINANEMITQNPGY